MTLSKKSKKTIIEFKKWRKEHGITHCQCGKKLTDEKHHFHCNECWKAKNEYKHINKNQIFKTLRRY